MGGLPGVRWQIRIPTIAFATVSTGFAGGQGLDTDIERSRKRMISIATGTVVDLGGILAAYEPRSAGKLLMVVRLLLIIVFSPAG
jgi:hypothetical protein